VINRYAARSVRHLIIDAQSNATQTHGQKHRERERERERERDADAETARGTAGEMALSVRCGDCTFVSRYRR